MRWSMVRTRMTLDRLPNTSLEPARLGAPGLPRVWARLVFSGRLDQLWSVDMAL
jgi:hypothetical protein